MRGCATRANFFVVYRVDSHLSHRKAGRLPPTASTPAEVYRHSGLSVRHATERERGGYHPDRQQERSQEDLSESKER